MEQVKEQTYYGKLSSKERTAYAIGDFACNLAYYPIASFLTMYYTNVAGISTSAFALIMMSGRILDAVCSVLFGFLVDRTNSPQGKTKPWIIRFCLPLAVSTVLLFSMPASFHGARAVIWCFVFYNLAKTVCYTAVNIPYGSMMSYLTGDPAERGRLNTIRIIFATSCQFLLNAFVLKIIRYFGRGDVYSQNGWTKAFICLEALGLILFLIHWFTVKERHHPAVQSEKVHFKKAVRYLFTNRNWLAVSATFAVNGLVMAISQSSITYFARYNLGNVDYYSWLTNANQITKFLCLIFLAPLLQKKLGKLKMFRYGLPLVMLGCMISILASASLAGVCIGNIIWGIGQSMEAAVNYSLVPDALESERNSEGAKYMGMGTATAFFLMKVSAAFGTLLWSFILNKGGFDPSLSVQSASGCRAVLICYLVVPLIAAMLNYIALGFWKETKKI